VRDSVLHVISCKDRAPGVSILDPPSQNRAQSEINRIIYGREGGAAPCLVSGWTQISEVLRLNG